MTRVSPGVGVGAVLPSSYAQLNTKGIFIPAGWGVNSIPALQAAAAGTGLFTAVWSGASGGAALLAADLFSPVSGVGGYVNILRGLLQGACGDGGCGFIPAIFGTSTPHMSPGGHAWQAANILPAFQHLFAAI